MTTLRHKPKTATPKRSSYKHAFVDSLPEKLDEGVLYISVRYATSAHNCFCGCGREVVTPIHPTKWRLSFDGVNVSLDPSVGSWSLACKSHYCLHDGRVEWARTFSDDEIQFARSRDLAAQDRYFTEPKDSPRPAEVEKPKACSFWDRVADWLQGK
jgi:hypothetical protein